MLLLINASPARPSGPGTLLCISPSLSRRSRQSRQSRRALQTPRLDQRTRSAFPRFAAYPLPRRMPSQASANPSCGRYPGPALWSRGKGAAPFAITPSGFASDWRSQGDRSQGTVPRRGCCSALFGREGLKRMLATNHGLSPGLPSTNPTMPLGGRFRVECRGGNAFDL